MFESFGDQCFSVLILVLSAGISSHICFGYGTRNAREAFIIFILILIVGAQFYHLINAAIYIPASRFYIFNNQLHRTDCLESQKGGKRPMYSQLSYDLNPCFCNEKANCTNTNSGEKIFGDCPLDGSVICIGNNMKEIPPYLSYLRNCRGGQYKLCSKEQPCYPCELNKLLVRNFHTCIFMINTAISNTLF